MGSKGVAEAGAMKREDEPPSVSAAEADAGGPGIGRVDVHLDPLGYLGISQLELAR